MVLLGLHSYHCNLEKTSFSTAMKMFEIDILNVRRYGKHIESQNPEEHYAKIYPHPSDSLKKNNSGTDVEDDDIVSKKLRNLPIKYLSLSFVAGCVTGYASKIATKLVAFSLGIAFIGLQLAQYQGWISIDWSDVEEVLVQKIDQNNDGKLTTKDLDVIWKRVKKVMTNRVPKSTAFLTGFLLGFYRG